jgi:hypothetical protein
LLAVSPLLATYSHNFTEVPLRHLALPVGVAIVACTAIWLSIFTATWNAAKSSIVTALFFAVFYGYGPAYDYLKVFDYTFDREIVRHIFVIPIVLGLWAILAWRVVVARRPFERATPLFNTFAIILVASNLFAVANELWNHRRPASSSTAAAHPLSSDGSAELPDLYYLILDGYTGFEGLQELHGYDNSAFADWLRARGFHVAPASQVQYRLSEQSTASTLNMRPLEEHEDAYAALRNNRTVTLLKQHDYVIYQAPVTAWGLFDLVDHPLGLSKKHRTTDVNDFLLLVLERSMLMPLSEYLISSDDYGLFQRNDVRYDLEQAVGLIGRPGPKLVYLHIHCPHWPWVFSSDGSPVPIDDYYNLEDPRFYLGQVEWITREIEKVIDTILESSERPAAIILQSDHGERGFAPLNHGVVLDVGDTWKNVLNAYYFPTRTVSAADDISPMATVRLFLETYGMLDTRPGPMRGPTED